MRATFFILLWILLFEISFGATCLHQREKSLPPPEPQSSLFGLIPPQPAKALKETLAYQTAPLFYPSQGIVLKVEGDMLLAHVNKTFALPSWYVPPDLVSLSGQVGTLGSEIIRKTVHLHLKDLLTEAAKACGCKMSVLSSYRSYQTQKEVHNYWINQVGQYYADLISARPGHSEHQLGTTVDLTSSTVNYQLTHNFGYTKEGFWLKDNAHKWGFVLSYPKGKDKVTGYIWEPWHFRYVGKKTAQKIHRRGITLEEYLSTI